MSKSSKYRLDVAALYAAVQQQRGAMSWRALAAQLGVGKRVFFRMRTGGGMDAHALVSIIAWLQRPLADFTRTADDESR